MLFQHSALYYRQPSPMPAKQPQRATAATDSSGSPIGIDESELWSIARALRGSMDAAEYTHVVLCPIFLKDIPNAWIPK